MNYMFEYTGVSVLAAMDGTIVNVDKNNDSTPDETCKLNQGATYQWNDSGVNANDAIGAGSSTVAQNRFQQRATRSRSAADGRLVRCFDSAPLHFAAGSTCGRTLIISR